MKKTSSSRKKQEAAKPSIRHLQKAAQSFEIVGRAEIAISTKQPFLLKPAPDSGYAVVSADLPPSFSLSSPRFLLTPEAAKRFDLGRYYQGFFGGVKRAALEGLKAQDPGPLSRSLRQYGPLLLAEILADEEGLTEIHKWWVAKLKDPKAWENLAAIFNALLAKGKGNVEKLTENERAEDARGRKQKFDARMREEVPKAEMVLREKINAAINKLPSSVVRSQRFDEEKNSIRKAILDEAGKDHNPAVRRAVQRLKNEYSQ